MALASTWSATVEGVAAHMVTVEANVGPGLPGMYMVGLGDAAVKESRERIRTAVANAALPWPRTKIMVSLSPAHLRKGGSHFDLPIALSVLGSLDPRAQARLQRTMIMGELALDGSLRRVEGVLPMLLKLQQLGEDGTGDTAGGRAIDTVVVPRANAQEAALLNHGHILVGDSLPQVWRWLLGEVELETASAAQAPFSVDGGPDFADVAGQLFEREAMEVAAAGGHHMLMVGPPGSGKSMLAERLPTILPPLGVDEQITTTALHSASGISRGEIVVRRPFIAPHPSLTKVELIGGGAGTPQPGAVSQAHNGVLFLDEASEINAGVLDALRIPIETGRVVIRRHHREHMFPADFQLILAANPCPCGKEAAECRCHPTARSNHLANISGPLRDRLDIFLLTSSQSAIVSPEGAESSAEIAQRVAQARERAAWRWQQAGLEVSVNARVPSTLIRRDFTADEESMVTLQRMLYRRELTQRGVDRTLKLAWTIADLAGEDIPHIDHVDKAIALRGGLMQVVSA
ncbi:Competence protein ComM [Corynebacterium glaucum]|uniref:YifB family Mg chelatase-like AAA ATPase n=1 Tax=Corynebacterium glaucum TaxID=187491 RepID=UPI0025B3A7E1|nr:YifB family Mg chelatase-like AAA ATPase [Corynebacterium glaucum]WJZ08039.1 Competence protein ComM [Corynebacterium glaucum]